MSRLLIISNGHGEDLSGSILGIELRKQGHKVHSFPLVGKGMAYQNAGIKVLGLRKQFSTGGIGYTSIIGRLTEFFQGQLFYLIKSLFKLFSIKNNYDLLIVVGDVVPIIAAYITNKEWVVYLVAYSSYYEGRLRLPWPASLCLINNRCLHIYSRDQFTADDLSKQLRRSVEFIGNPFMDYVLINQDKLDEKYFRLGLLPGSRSPEIYNNILMILNVLKCLPISFFLKDDVSFDMALVDAICDDEFINLVAKKGWYLDCNYSGTEYMKFYNDKYFFNVHRKSFSKILHSSDILLSMSGTATEQAIGLAKPVVQLPGKGPQFTSSFAEAQRRLLGETVFCAEDIKYSKTNIFLDTSDLILNVSARLQIDMDFIKLCKIQADLRIGRQGGAKPISESISKFLERNMI